MRFGIENGEEFISEIKKTLTSESKKYYNKAAKRIDKAIYDGLFFSSPNNEANVVWRLWDNRGQRSLFLDGLSSDDSIIKALFIKMEHHELCYENIDEMMEKYGIYSELRAQVYDFLIDSGFFKSVSDKKVREAVARLRVRTREKLKEKEIQEEIRKHDTERAITLLKNEISTIIRHMDTAGMSEEDLIQMIREFRIEKIQNG